MRSIVVIQVQSCGQDHLTNRSSPPTGMVVPLGILTAKNVQELVEG